jgi:hypothetical protein
MKVLRTALVIVVAMAPLTGRADGLSYSYWDLSYIAADIDGLDQKLDGYGVGGSIELSEQVFLYGSYADVSTTIFGFEASEQDAGIGLGYAWPVAENIDLVGRAGYAHAKADVEDFGSIDDDGYTLGIGVRGRFADSFEVEGGVQYADFKDLGDGTGVGLGFQWYFTPQVAVTFSGSYSDDSTGYSIGLRGTWGR